MMAAAITEPMTAIGTLRLGLRASPAMFTGPWKPLKENTMPEVATAVSTAERPYGAKPPCWWKLPLWKPVEMRPTMVAAGMANLSAVIQLLACEKALTDQ